MTATPMVMAIVWFAATQMNYSTALNVRLAVTTAIPVPRLQVNARPAHRTSQSSTASALANSAITTRTVQALVWKPLPLVTRATTTMVKTTALPAVQTALSAKPTRAFAQLAMVTLM